MQTKFIQINKNSWYMRLSWDDVVNYKSFKDILLNNLYLNKEFIIQFKVRYDDNKYIMLSKQIVFKYNSTKDLEDMFDIIQIQMNYKLDNYNINSLNFAYILIKFIEINKVLLSDVKYDKERTKSNDIQLKRNILNIPVSIDHHLLGDELAVYQVEGKNKLKLPNPYEDIIINDVLYNEVFSGNTKVYFRYGSPPHMLYVTNTSPNTVEKALYTVRGTEITKIIDVYESDRQLVRYENSSKQVIVIDNNEIISKTKEFKFDPIPQKAFKDNYHQDLRIGVMDLETFYDINTNSTKVYSGGFRTYITDECHIEYIDKNYNSDEVIINLINEMLRPKYENIKFYCHNLGGYDAIYILKVLYKFNETNTNKYIVDVLFNDDKALKIVIRRKNKDKMLKVTLLDSYTLLKASLRVLAIKFEVNTLKGYFPYRFVNYRTLFYKGTTPDIEWYENIDTNTYQKLVTQDWDLKHKTIQYLEDDLNSLYEVLKKFSRGIFKLFDSEITDSLTISSLSLQIFLKNYYNDANLIPNIKNKKVYSEIKHAYYGGITEVYKPKGSNLYYYDVNSLYPYVSINDMVGLNSTYTEYVKSIENLDDLFGFYLADIDNSSCNLYLGLLPYRGKDGLYFPKGKWSGWYFSEELKFAKLNGYNINVIRGYTFNRQKGIFDKYVKDIYKIKATSVSSSDKTLAKSLLNNLLGRFGLDINKPITKIVNNETYEQVLLTSPLLNDIKISEDAYMISYIPTLDTSISNKLNIDPQKAFNKFKHLNSSESDSTPNREVSVPISAAITSYGRIHISKLKLDILKKGGNIYYSDTDSIVTDIKLDDSLVSPNELGKLKLEHKITEGYFISNKTYAFINDKGDVIKKSKGLDSNLLSYQDYVDMYYEKSIDKKYRLESIKDYSKGYVNINRANILLSPFSYKKRKKIYNDKLWVDTEPLQV